jgi:hypothetical protein
MFTDLGEHQAAAAAFGLMRCTTCQRSEGTRCVSVHGGSRAKGPHPWLAQLPGGKQRVEASFCFLLSSDCDRAGDPAT